MIPMPVGLTLPARDTAVRHSCNFHQRISMAAVWQLVLPPPCRLNSEFADPSRVEHGIRWSSLRHAGLCSAAFGTWSGAVRLRDGQSRKPRSESNLTPRDRKLLANASYAQARIPQPYLRHIVDYHRREAPGSIVVDSDARYLYFVLPQGKAIRYGVTVGEEAMVFSGVARVGRLAEWPDWRPTESIKARLNVPNFVAGGPDNPMGARGIYLYQNGRDTLYRIHGTNQPEYIGSAISSGCIRMTNEDVIDLYNRVNVGATVVVLAPGQGDSPPIRAWPSVGRWSAASDAIAGLRPVRKAAGLQWRRRSLRCRFFFAPLRFCESRSWRRPRLWQRHRLGLGRCRRLRRLGRCH